MSENIVSKTAVVANITEISTKQLCEFSDKQILRLSGRPQPFLEYSPETLYELVESNPCRVSCNLMIKPINRQVKVIMLFSFI